MLIAYFIFHHCLISNNRSGVKLATNHRHSSFGFALWIRQHQTLLCVIRLSQTASPVAGAWSFYFILSLTFFSCFILFLLWDSHYIVTELLLNKTFTREIVSITAGDTKMCFLFCLFCLLWTGYFYVCLLKSFSTLEGFWKWKESGEVRVACHDG